MPQDAAILCLSLDFLFKLSRVPDYILRAFFTLQTWPGGERNYAAPKIFSTDRGRLTQVWKHQYIFDNVIFYCFLLSNSVSLLLIEFSLFFTFLGSFIISYSIVLT